MKTLAEAERKAIGTRLREENRRLGHKHITTFAEAAGVPYRTMQGYVDGKRVPSGVHFGGLVAAGVDIVWVMTGQAAGSVSEAVALDVLADGNRDLADALGMVLKALRSTWSKDDPEGST